MKIIFRPKKNKYYYYSSPRSLLKFQKMNNFKVSIFKEYLIEPNEKKKILSDQSIKRYCPIHPISKVDINSNYISDEKKKIERNICLTIFMSFSQIRKKRYGKNIKGGQTKNEMKFIYSSLFFFYEQFPEHSQNPLLVMLYSYV